MDLVQPRTGSSPALGHSIEPLKLSTDEFMLTQIEAFDDKNRDADRHNLETFGEDALPGGGAWDYDSMMEANCSLWVASQGMSEEMMASMGWTGHQHHQHW